MIDLSNNNGAVDFKRVFASGHRRVYLKRSEGTGFVDRTYPALRRRAHEAKLKVGAYHFAHPLEHTPREEAAFFLRLLPKPRRDAELRACLDIEQGHASARMGQWVLECAELVARELGYAPVIYGPTFFLEALRLPRAPGPLWLASFGRNDGREHPFRVPRPWKTVAAHQFSSRSRVAGVAGFVDVSHLFSARALDPAGNVFRR